MEERIPQFPGVPNDPGTKCIMWGSRRYSDPYLAVVRIGTIGVCGIRTSLSRGISAAGLSSEVNTALHLGGA